MKTAQLTLKMESNKQNLRKVHHTIEKHLQNHFNENCHDSIKSTLHFF